KTICPGSATGCRREATSRRLSRRWPFRRRMAGKGFSASQPWRVAWRRWSAKKSLNQFLKPSSCRTLMGTGRGNRRWTPLLLRAIACWRYDWVLEFDIKGLFDNISHDLLLRALEKHTGCEWARL